MKTLAIVFALALSVPAYAYDDHDRQHQSFIEQQDRQRGIRAQEDIADELRRQNDFREQEARREKPELPRLPSIDTKSLWD